MAATTVAQYLAELPPERRAVVARVRDVVRADLPAGYEESMLWGMICWSVPLARYPDTYNGRPLGYACLAAQKNHYALYLTALYMDPAATERFTQAFAAAGKRLDMGKSCVRFKALEDIPLDVIGQAVARTSPDDYIAMYERARATSTTRAVAKKRSTKKAAAKKGVSAKAAAKQAARGG